MDKSINKKSLKVKITLTLILIVVSVMALTLGRYKINIFNIFNNEKDLSVLINLRIPRVLLSIIVGASLSVSGLIYQEIFRNKLVSPDFLGVQAGSSVGASLAIILGLQTIYISMFAFVLGIITIVITLLISKLLKNENTTILILSGLIVSSLMSALLSIMKYLAPTENSLSDITFWLMGSFSKVTYNDFIYIVPLTFIPLIILYFLKFRINVIGQGREDTEIQGINYTLNLYVIVILTTLITATSVAFSGIVGWVGLIVPHIIRLMLGKNFKFTFINTMILGSIFTVLADLLSRTFTNSEIPVSAITGLIGSLLFVITLFKTKDVVIHDI